MVLLEAAPEQTFLIGGTDQRVSDQVTPMHATRMPALKKRGPNLPFSYPAEDTRPSRKLIEKAPYPRAAGVRLWSVKRGKE